MTTRLRSLKKIWNTVLCQMLYLAAQGLTPDGTRTPCRGANQKSLAGRCCDALVDGITSPMVLARPQKKIESKLVATRISRS
uniref:Putative secreted protein n=1 Tax=Ixodes ricinus TaxID=34613 RepID=A0A6B0U8T4_IXORI